MKQNIKFLSIVVSIILVSSIALTGAMHAVGDYDEETKPNEKAPEHTSNVLQDSEGDIDCTPSIPVGDSPIEDDPISDTPIGGDVPNSQQTMKAKFEAMYDINDAENTITVISADTLERIWQSNYEKEVVRSLAVEEVYYIIQDSVRIYNEYDRVILSEFAPSSSDEAIVARIPSVKGEVIDTTKSDYFEHYCRYSASDLEAIVRIVIYRLRALSSPGALFTGEEVIRAVGADPDVYSTMLPKTLFYIPDYSKDTDRDEYIAVTSLTILSNTVASETLSDIFALCDVGGYIELLHVEAGYNGWESAKIFPTVEMKDRICPYFSVTVTELDGALIENKSDGLYVDGKLLCGGFAEGVASFCLYDLTGDGRPEICTVISVGSGIVSDMIAIFDYDTRECIFSLHDRVMHDYSLFVRDGKLCVAEREHSYTEILLTSTGALIFDGSNITWVRDAEINYSGTPVYCLSIDPDRYKLE